VCRQVVVVQVCGNATIHTKMRELQTSKSYRKEEVIIIIIVTARHDGYGFADCIEIGGLCPLSLYETCHFAMYRSFLYIADDVVVVVVVVFVGTECCAFFIVCDDGVGE